MSDTQNNFQDQIDFVECSVWFGVIIIIGVAFYGLCKLIEAIK